MAATRTYPANGLEIDFLGLPMVFNDGQAQNTLIVALTNNNFSGSLQATQDNNIVFGPQTPISLWFVVDVAQGSSSAMRSWALASYDRLHDEEVSLVASPGNWDVRRSDNLSGNPLNDSLKGWQLTAQEDVTLLPGHSLLLTLSGFTSSSPDGTASGYVQVDIPHLDNSGNLSQHLTKVIGPILKSKVMITGERMGIGTGSPNSTLEVNGAVRARGGEPGQDDINNNGFFFDGVGEADSGMTSLEDGNLTFYASGWKVLTLRQQADAWNTEILGDLQLLDPDYGGSSGSLSVAGTATVAGDITSAWGRIKDRWGPVMPVGAIVAYGGSEPPPGWLLCNGAELPQIEDDTTYDALRAVVGDTVPDLRDRFIVGASGSFNRGDWGGEASVRLTMDQMPAHRHGHRYGPTGTENLGWIGDTNARLPWFFQMTDRQGGLFGDPAPDLADARAQSIVPAGGGVPHNNMPPYYALTYIIKY